MRGVVTGMSSLLVLAAVCCKSAPLLPLEGGIAPGKIAFKNAYLGTAPQTILLNEFTVGGKAISGATFSLETSTPVFILFQAGPLDLPPRLQLRTTFPGDFKGTLTVSIQGLTFQLPITATVIEPPRCDSDTGCRTGAFDLEAGRCVWTNVEDGTHCALSDCGGDQICQQGSCTYLLRPGATPRCSAPESEVTLTRAWTYAATPDRRVLFSGVADTAGNLYALNCPADREASSAYLFSLSSDGVERWRTMLGEFNGYNCPRMRLSVIGGHLFVAYRPAWGTVTALRTTDGAVVWWSDPSDDVTGIAAATPEIAGLTIQKTGQAYGVAVVFLSPTLDSEIARYQPVSTGYATGIVSDGQGTLFVNTSSSVGGFHDTVTAVSLTAGPLWGADIENATALASDGAHLFLSNGSVVGGTQTSSLFRAPLGDLAIGTSGQQGFAAIKRLEEHGCTDSGLKRFRTTDGALLGTCRLEEPTGESTFLTPLSLAQDGGVVFLAKRSQALETSPSLLWMTPDGRIRLKATLTGTVMPNPAVYPSHGAIVGNRWVMDSWVAEGVSGITAYDVPGLALAEHGWVTPGGNQQRNQAPW